MAPNPMRKCLSYFFAVLLSFFSINAADFIVVVDASQSMKGFIPLLNKRGKSVRKQKTGLVQEQLVNFLQGIPINEETRVYVVYFDKGIKKDFSKEYKFNAKGKQEAIEQAEQYSKKIVAGAGDLFGGTTWLWSTFHQVLTKAEKEKYYRPGDKANGVPEVFPHIILLSDGKDEQDIGPNKWFYSKAPPPNNNVPPEKRVQADQIIIKRHPWLPEHKNAIWFQLGDLKAEWKGKVVVAGGNIELILPPSLKITDVNEEPLQRGDSGIEEIKEGEKVILSAVAGENAIFQRFQVYIKEGEDWNKLEENANAKVVGKGVWEFVPKKFGLNEFRVTGFIGEGEKEKEQEDAAGYGSIFIPKPVAAKLDVKAAFEVRQIIGGKPVNAIEDGNIIWMGNKNPRFKLIDKTIAVEMMGKEKRPAKGLEYEWTINGKVIEGPDVELKEGASQIGLIVKKSGKEEGKAKILNVSVKKPQLEVQIKLKGTVAKGETIKVDQGKPVQFTWNFQNGGPQKNGLLVQYNYGDKNKGNEDIHTYQIPTTEKKPFQPFVTITLPDGGTIEETYPDVIVQAAKVVMSAEPLTPWPGKTVTFSTPAKDAENVTWIINGKRIEGDPDKNFQVGHEFQKPGVQEIMIEIKRQGIEQPLKDKITIEVQDVDPIVKILNVGEIYIGQKINIMARNAKAKAGDNQFPEGYTLEFIDGQGKIINPQKMAFKEPGKMVLTPQVKWLGLEKPIKSAEPIEVEVKGVEIDFEMELKTK